MQKNKILVVTQGEVTHVVGGAITVFVNFCNMLVENDYEVYGTCYSKILGNPSGLNSGVNFSNLYEEYGETDFSSLMNKKVELVKPDLIVFFFPRFYIEANLSSKFDNIPRILMFHSRPDVYFFGPRHPEKKLKAVYVNTVSQILLDSFYTLLPDFIQKDIVITIPNVIKKPKQTIRTDIEHKKIIYLSRVDGCKGLEFLINSFALIADKYRDWSIDIYGQSQPPAYVNALVKLVQKKSLSKQIFFKGVTATPIETMLNYDFCVFPSYFEGFGLGLGEALSVGLPCIGLKGCSGVNELIIHNYNGYLVEENYADMAQKIEKMILNKDIRADFSKNAIVSIGKFDSIVVNTKWLNLIEKMINKAPLYNYQSHHVQNEYSLFPIKRIVKMARASKLNLKWYQYIFSIKNSDNKNHKVITFAGIKLKYKKSHKKISTTKK